MLLTRHTGTLLRNPMLGRILRPRLNGPAVPAVLLGIAFLCFGLDRYMHSPERGLPFCFVFSSRAADRGAAFGGTWEVVNGSMRNQSNDRGAKLIAGSPYWRDYSVSADIQLLGDGDAGLIARVSNAENGVDSYSGYYGGLRTMDSSLVLGRAEHGWEEYPIKTFPGGVKPFHWYHVSLTVRGCDISATATDLSSGATASTLRHTVNCLAAGRIGLRSYTSGGLWRNIVVRSLHDRAERLTSLAELPPPEAPTGQHSLLAEYVSNSVDPPGDGSEGALAQTIGSLRYLSSISAKTALVRGIVVLTAPSLYVQDTTGGVKIEPEGGPSLKIGDEVEASGIVEPHEFSAVLKHANIRLLWEGSPVPPFSVTAGQAATGAYDASFIQTDGQLTARRTDANGETILNLEQGPQEFQARLKPGRSISHVRNLRTGSTLRLRGICSVDPGLTGNVTPFVLLVPSSEDLQVIAGPPWWSWSTLIPLGLMLFAASAGVHHAYVLAKHWRLRAVVDERERLAHEIHDTLAQSFAGLAFQLQAIRNSMHSEFPVLEQQVLLACDLVRHSHEEARRSIASLRPQTLESVGLLVALQACAAKMVRHGNVQIVTSSKGNPQALPLRTKDTLFRIGQEAIANALHHAEPKTIVITTVYDSGVVRLRIEDDGNGFSPESETRGFGLNGMRKRAESISADFRLVSAPASGTLVEIAAPLPAKTSIVNWHQRVWQYRRSYERSNSYSYR